MEDGKRSRRRAARRNNNEGLSIKNAIYISGIILVLGIIAFVITVIVYNNSLNNVYKDLESKQLGEVSNFDSEISDVAYEEQTETASSTIRKNFG